MGKETITRVNLSKVIVDKLRQDIANGRVKPGELLPSHEELCRRWGVSRVTLREALHRLEVMGLVEMQQGRGTFIREQDSSFFEKHLEFYPVIDQRTVSQLLESRKVIETALAKLAAERASAEELQRMQELLYQMEAIVKRDDALSFASIDFLFHRTIAQAASNDILLLMLDKISNLMQIQQRNIFTYEDQQGAHIIELSFEDHREIFRSIQLRNGEGAAKRMYQHIHRIQELIEAYYRARGEQPERP